MWFGGLQRLEEIRGDFPVVVASVISKSEKRAKSRHESFFNFRPFCAKAAVVEITARLSFTCRMPFFTVRHSAAWFLLCLSTSAATAQEESLPLNIRWQAGHHYTQETTTETTTQLTAAGGAEDQKMKVVQTTDIQVKEAGEGRKSARVTFRSLRGDVMLRGVKHSFDSARMSEASPLVQASLGKSVGRSFELLYDAEDHFLDVRDTSALAGEQLASPSLETIAEAREVAELYRRSLEIGLPRAPVKPGDRWTTQEGLDFPSAGRVNIELRARLESVVDYEGRQHAKISFEGEMKRADESAGTRKVTIGDGSRVFGQVLFDVERGTVSLAAFRADIQLEIEGKKIPVRQQVTTKLTSFTKAS